MIRWQAVVLGALTFLVAHAVLITGWRTWFEPGGTHSAWFLNSGRSVAFTVVCLVAGSALAGAIGRGRTADWIATGGTFAAGAVAAMTVVLFSGDAGTIYPIVLAFGGCIALLSGIAGALAGGAMRQAISRR